MRFSVPHPIPYQGSKRRLADAILSHIPARRYRRLVEPFVGSGSVTLAAAHKGLFSSYLIGDALEPLIGLWNSVIEEPQEIANEYESLWYRERADSINAYYEIRAEFNKDKEPSKLLYLLARCVKNAVRFNPSGEFNQSSDKRRKGTRPATMLKELLGAHSLLRGKCEATATDFLHLVNRAQEGDFFYLDPPYQGTSVGRDQRYIAGVSRERTIEALEVLNKKCVPFILSYDGYCGSRTYGEMLPENIAHRILLDVGRSSQATLNGDNHVTIESLYLSHSIADFQKPTHRSLEDYAAQSALFGVST